MNHHLQYRHPTQALALVTGVTFPTQLPVDVLRKAANGPRVLVLVTHAGDLDEAPGSQVQPVATPLIWEMNQQMEALSVSVSLFLCVIGKP